MAWITRFDDDVLMLHWLGKGQIVPGIPQRVPSYRVVDVFMSDAAVADADDYVDTVYNFTVEDDNGKQFDVQLLGEECMDELDACADVELFQGQDEDMIKEDDVDSVG